MASIINLATEENQEKIMRMLKAEDGKGYVPIMKPAYSQIDAIDATTALQIPFTLKGDYLEDDTHYYMHDGHTVYKINKQDFTLENEIYNYVDSQYPNVLCDIVDWEIVDDQLYILFLQGSYKYIYICKVDKKSLKEISSSNRLEPKNPNTGAAPSNNNFKFAINKNYIYVAVPATNYFIFVYKKSDYTFMKSILSMTGADRIFICNSYVLTVSNSGGNITVFTGELLNEEIVRTNSNDYTKNVHEVYLLDENRVIILTTAYINIFNLSTGAIEMTIYENSFNANKYYRENDFIYYSSYSGTSHTIKRFSLKVYKRDNQFSISLTTNGIPTAMIKRGNDYVILESNLLKLYSEIYQIIGYEGIE